VYRLRGCHRARIFGQAQPGCVQLYLLVEIDMKMNNFRTILVSFVSLSILFFALPVFAQNGAIKVKCVDASSNPVQGVNISLISSGGPSLKDKKTDSKGEAEFTKLNDGLYRVVGRKDGFEPALFEFVTLKGTAENVTMKMTAGADKRLYFEVPGQDQKALDLVNQGLALYKENKFSDAEKIFSQAAELDPSNPDSFRYLGLSLLQQAKFEQAIEQLNRASKLAGLYAGAPLPTAAQYQQIVDNIQGLMKQMPVFKARNAAKEKNFEEAVAQFTEALKNDPNNAELYSSIAIVQANANKLDEALAAISKAVQLKPDNKEYVDLKAKLSTIKERDEAAKAQQALIQTINDGDKLFQDGDSAGALKKYQEAIAKLPDENKALKASVWRQIGRSQAKLNQVGAAIDAFKKSIDFAPDEKTALDYRKSFAQFYLDQKKNEEALNVLTEAKDSDAQSLEPTLLKLFDGFKNSQPKLAEMVLERVIKINPQNANAYFELGQMYYMDGKSMDGRTKELFAKYQEIGKDEDKLSRMKDMLVIINRRSK
jgi:tetratricopeptide (TPR) repeat protein